MKRLTIAALLVALACAPSVVRAETPGGRSESVGEAQTRQLAGPAPADSSRSEAADYAAREAAAPTLADFAGGGGGIYIGSGAVVILLLVVIILLLV
jgi:hypothetical protein